MLLGGEPCLSASVHLFSDISFPWLEKASWLLASSFAVFKCVSECVTLNCPERAPLEINRVRPLAKSCKTRKVACTCMWCDGNGRAFSFAPFVFHSVLSRVTDLVDFIEKLRLVAHTLSLVGDAAIIGLCVTENATVWHSHFIMPCFVFVHLRCAKGQREKL